MTNHPDRYDATEPDPDADRWSAWLPPLHPTSDHTGAADSSQAPPPLPQRPGPSLPQSAGPARPPAPAPASAYAPSPPTAPASHSSWVTPPKSHLGMAIASVIFGFTFFGIVAVVKAASVNSLWAQGRTGAAARASRLARNWAIAAFVLDVIWFLGAVIVPDAITVGP